MLISFLVVLTFVRMCAKFLNLKVSTLLINGLIVVISQVDVRILAAEHGLFFGEPRRLIVWYSSFIWRSTKFCKHCSRMTTVCTNFFLIEIWPHPVDLVIWWPMFVWRPKSASDLQRYHHTLPRRKMTLYLCWSALHCSVSRTKWFVIKTFIEYHKLDRKTKNLIKVNHLVCGVY